MKNQAFIDAQNLHLGTTTAKPSWKIDLMRFRVYLERKYNVSEAYYFLGVYDPKLTKMYDSIQKAGYILRFREHSPIMTGKKKGNVDTDIVFTILTKIIDKEKFDKVVLVSGDGDYWKMVEYLINKDLFLKLLAPNQKSISSLYKRISDSYRDFLDNNPVKMKIQYKRAKNK
jgi:uncharacterized LabA/DUF88 family protein